MTIMTIDFPYPSQRMPIFAENVVATSQPLAAQAGLRALQRGGNAVDAAVAAAIALAVVEPTSNGIGGDAFAVVWDGGQLVGLNASGRSPKAMTRERFAGCRQMPLYGWDSVTVPGAPSAWLALSERFGKLPFAALFDDAIRYAERGYLVSPITARAWARAPERYRGFTAFAETFLPGGRAPQAGERFVCPAMAQTLALIAESRTEAFYRGALAEAMVADARKHGGLLREADLAEHRCQWVTPLAQPFGEVVLHELPPNGQGLAALMAAGIVAQLPLADYPVDSAESLHLQIEAMKLALADAYRYIADPAAMALAPEALLDPEYLASRARLIDPQRAQDFGHGVPKRGGTVYLTAADAEGMMVSYIQSNYYGFGSGVVIPGTGISLQNRAAGFTLEPDHPNAVGPAKRPFHTIIPGFITRAGAPLMSFGVMGGPMQAQGHLQMLVRTQLYRQNLQAASDAPRWRVLGGLGVALERGFAIEVLEGLSARGHQLHLASPDESFSFGGAQLVMRLPGGYMAASDHRKDGQAVGY